MGSSKNYTGKPGWQGNNTARGKESKYTSTPVARMEGSHMSGENESGRKGTKAGKGKSGTFSGPKKRSPAASGY